LKKKKKKAGGGVHICRESLEPRNLKPSWATQQYPVSKKQKKRKEKHLKHLNTVNAE
jgi:hypothetical protein